MPDGKQDGKVESNVPEVLQPKIRDTNTEYERLAFITIFFMVTTETAGMAMLNVPYAYVRSGGMIISTLIQMIQVVLTISSMIALVGCVNTARARGYLSTVRFFCGKAWMLFAGVVTFMMSYAYAITLIRLMGDQFELIFKAYLGQDYKSHWYTNQIFVVSVLGFIVILPYSVFKTEKTIRIASVVGFIVTAYLVILIPMEFIEIGSHGTIIIATTEFTDIFKAVPIIHYAYTAQGSWVGYIWKYEDKQNAVKTFWLAFCCIGYCFFIYTWAGFFGLATFGSTDIPKDMMMAYNAKSAEVLVAIFCVLIKCVIIFPDPDLIRMVFDWANTKCCGDSKKQKLKPCCGLDYNRTLRLYSGLLWLTLSAIAALYLPDISVIINYIGVFSTFPCFFFPGLMLIFASKRTILNRMLLKKCPYFRITKRVKSTGFFFTFYGIFAFALCLFAALIWQLHKYRTLSR